MIGRAGTMQLTKSIREQGVHGNEDYKSHSRCILSDSEASLNIHFAILHVVSLFGQLRAEAFEMLLEQKLQRARYFITVDIITLYRNEEF